MQLADSGLDVEELDVCDFIARALEASIAGDERNAQGFGQYQERRVVGRDVVSQCPHSIDQWLMGIAHDGQIGEIGPQVSCSILAHCLEAHQPTEGMHQLYIDQMRSVEIAVGFQALS